MVGVVEDILADRAFIEQRDTSAAELCTIADLASPGARTSSPNALAAAALARSHGVAQAAVRDGLRGFRPDGHRIATVADADGVTWVDDSKATNPHAAQSSLQAYDPVVWVAGGLAKGARFDDLVLAVRDRLRGVVLLGRDRGVIADALSRHAPDVPVIVVGGRRDWSRRRWTAHGARRGGGGPVGPTRRHGAAGSRMRLHGHVRQLRRARRRLRRRRTTTHGPARRAPTTGGRHAMTTREPRVAGHRPSAPPHDAAPVCAWTSALRHALDRPLTSYYLLLGASALLLTIGLIMVLSASSVYSFKQTTTTPTPSSSAS